MVNSLTFTDFFPNIHFDDEFENFFRKRLKKDVQNKIRVKKQVKKIICEPDRQKNLKYGRKNTQEVYVDPFRLYYHFSKSNETIYFLEISHKDDQ